MNEEAKDLIDKISQISDKVKTELKPLVIKLSDNIAKNINHPEMVNIAKQHNIENPTEKDVGTIMEHLRKKYEWSFSHNTLYRHLNKKYYEAKVESYSDPVRIDAILKDPERLAKLEEKIRDFKRKNSPAKPIITKDMIKNGDKYTWSCHLAEELADIAIKMEKEHSAVNELGQPLNQHDDSLCKEYAKRAKMVRDSRFATNANAYEAIICACNTTQSLKNAIRGEWEFKTFWEILKDMKDCRECIHEKCEEEQCNHECHRVVRPMTTKGLKYAIKTNDDLKELDEHIKRLQLMDNDNCKIGKILLENPKTKKLVGATEIKKLIYSHIEKDECLQCDLFLEKNPNFFESFK